MNYGSDGVHVDAERIATGRSLERATEALNGLVNALTDLQLRTATAVLAVEDADSRFAHGEPRIERAKQKLQNVRNKLEGADELADAALSEIADILRDE